MIPKGLVAQRDFSAGEVNAEAARRDDTDLVKSGCRVLRNAELGQTGAAYKRAALKYKYQGQGRLGRLLPVPDTELDIMFRAGQMIYHNNKTGERKTLDGCPWTADDITHLTWALVQKQLIVAAPGLRTQILAYDEDLRTWSIKDFDFEDGQDGAPRMPYFRFGEKGVTLTVTGDLKQGSTVTLRFSKRVLVADHVGKCFTYGKGVVRITDVLSPTSAKAVNLTQLARQIRLHPRGVRNNSVEGFRVGDIVENLDTQAKAQVVSLKDKDLIVFAYDIDGDWPEDSYVVGPNASFRLSDDSAETKGYGTTLWEEQFISDYRGWPGAVAYDRERIMFYRFDQLPDAYVQSAIGSPLDFKVGSNATDAIFERNPTGEKILHMCGGADQYMLTTGNIFYSPVSAQNPVAPGSIEPSKIGSGGARDHVPPVQTNRGVVFVSADGKRVMAIRKTGTQTQPYILDDISRYHSHLIKDPVALAVMPAGIKTTTETLYVVNADGTVAAGMYNADRDWVGFVPWETEGLFRDVAAGLNDVIFSVERELSSGATVFNIEVPTDGFLVDGAINVETDGSTTNDIYLTVDGVNLLANGQPIQVLTVDREIYANADVYLIKNGVPKGIVTLEGDGSLPDKFTDEGSIIGFVYDFALTPFTANFDSGQSQGQRLNKRKINRWAVSVKDAQEIKIGRRKLGGYKIGQDLGQPQAKLTTTHSGTMLGKAWEPELPISQDWPGTVTITEVSMEVTS